MKSKKIFFLLIFCFFVFYPFISTADTLGSSVYQTIINDMALNNGSMYSQYISNRHCVIFDLSNFHDCQYWGYDESSTNELNSITANNRYNNNQSYKQYVAYFFRSEPRIDQVTDSYSKYAVGQYLQLDHRCATISNANNTKGAYCVYWIDSYGNVNHINFSNFSDNFFYFDDGINVIFNDDTIRSYYNDVLIDTYESSVYTLNPYEVEITGSETENEMYQKIMSWFNSNANFYANVWAQGEKPTILILNNRNRDVIANKLSSNSVSNFDYICCLYPNRFCEYETNNNSIHYNFFNYNQQFYYICANIGTSGNIFFYRFPNITSQGDVAQITNNTNNRIFFCNTNILKRNSADNFAINSNGAHVVYYTSSYEDSQVYPVNPNDDPTNNSGIWTEEEILNVGTKLDDINNNTSFLSRIFAKIEEYWSDLWNVASDFLSTKFTDLIAFFSRSIGFSYVTDILNYVKSLKTDAISYKESVLALPGINFSFVFLGSSITFNPFLFFFEHLYFYFYRVINACFIVFMCCYFYGKTYKLIRKVSWGGEHAINHVHNNFYR